METPTDRPALSVGRQRRWSPVAERPQRMHRFTGRLRAAVDDATAGGVHGLAVGSLSAAEAAETVLELREVIARLHGLELAVLARADAAGVSTEVEGRPVTVDTTAWLVHAGLTDPRAARREVVMAGELTGHRSATGSALLAGDIDRAQADVIAWALSRLPDWVTAEKRDEAEQRMLEEAQRLDAAQLRRLGRGLLTLIDPDGAEKEEARRVQAEEDEASRSTSLALWDDGKGVTHLFGKVPTRHGQMLRKVIDAIASPQLPDAVARTRVVDNDDGPVLAARPTTAVRGEALCRLVETLDPEQLPSSGGMTASVVVTMTLETLMGGLATAHLDTGAEVSAGEARRMACSAGVVPVVLGGPSEVLDHGRRRRLHSKPQRLAMAVRQGFRCAAEGCNRPTAWCDAHHLVPWSEGGATDLDDGVLICARHHTLAHHPRFRLERRPDHRVTIIRKPRDAPLRR